MMSKGVFKTHGELLRSRQPGHGMPGELFSRRDVWETDLDIFLLKHWILVGVTADVPEPGDGSGVVSGKARSEEHNSELQSVMGRSHAGICLKKSNKT